MTKYNRTHHLPFSLGVSNDDRVSKDIDSLLGIDIVITEKLDGENCGMNNFGVYARSHAVFTDSPWSREVRKLHRLKVLSQLGSESIFLFGENMEGVHSIEYNKLESYFYIFGVRDGLTWLSWNDVELYASLLDIPTVPVLFKGIVNTKEHLIELVNSLTIESMLGDTIEGIVIRNVNSFNDSAFKSNVMKWVRKGHVQTDTHWTRNWKKAKLSVDNIT